MRAPVTEITVAEDGTESHESWLLIRANHISSTPGTRLFDSEIAHSRFIRVTINRCKRQRELSHDYHFEKELILEMDMSQAQWGAFVSSFGNGTGVPATLSWMGGQVPQAPFESRLDESHKEVRGAAEKATDEIRKAYLELEELFEEGAGKKAIREKMNTLRARIQNAPANMAFAARSLTEHTENVVTKARADLEGMVLAALDQGQIEFSSLTLPQIGKPPEDAA